MRALDKSKWRTKLDRMQVKGAFLRAFLKTQLLRLVKGRPWNTANSTQSEMVVVAAKIDTISGYAFDSQGKLFPQSSSWAMPEAYFRWPVKPIFAKSYQANKPLCFLGSSAYYHWLLEDLPSYLRAKAMYPNSWSGHPKDPHPYVLDILKLLGEASQTVSIYAAVPALVLSPKGLALSPNRQDIEILEKFHLDSKIAPGSRTRLYISRRDSGRYPDNESEIEKLVLDKGYEVVSLTGLTLSEQISLFSGAEVIIGTHGAGLSNIVWSNSRTRVVEIARPDQPDCFAKIASLKSIPLRRLMPAQSKRGWTVNLSTLEALT